MKTVSEFDKSIDKADINNILRNSVKSFLIYALTYVANSMSLYAYEYVIKYGVIFILHL